MRRACVIVAKAPVAGAVKTRLVPPLTAEGAGALYAGFLLDAVELALSLDWEGVSVIHPLGARSELARLLPRVVKLIEQRAHGLEAALRQVFEQHFDERFDRVVMIGSDNPTLPRGPLEAACNALDRSDLSIGPTVDGGYYLLGMRQFQNAVFEHIDWSTPRVYRQTLEQAERAGLSVAAVQEWFDIDEPADLERLHRDLADTAADVAPNTRRALSALTAPSR